MLRSRPRVDRISREKRSHIMACVRSTGNRTTGRRLRAFLVRAGIRGFRIQANDLLGKPDFVFREERVVIFVDGSFWHGAPGFNRFPKSRLEYWAEKIEGNRRRDREVTNKLRAAGWSVIRIWDSELEQCPQEVVRRIERTLSARSKLMAGRRSPRHSD